MKHELSADTIKQTVDALYTAVARTGKPELMPIYAYWLSVQQAQLYIKPEPELKILMEIKGGNLNSVYCTRENTNITLIDHDNMDQGDRDLEENNYPVIKVEPGYIEKRIAEVYNDYQLSDEKHKS